MSQSEKSFKDLLIDYFEHTRKTSWGKNEIVKTIKDLWIDRLEEIISKGKPNINY